MVMYTAKILNEVDNGKGYWQSLRIGIFQDDNQIGEYIRGYHGFGESTFHPFNRGENWYALASMDYTKLSVMELPSCKVIGEEVGGFCPVDIYIPQYQIRTLPGLPEEELHKYPVQNHSRLTKTRYEKEYDPDLFNNDWTPDRKFFPKQLPTFYENIAFVAGCIWGDDSSWKIELRDISKAHEGIISRIDIGYLEMPINLKLKECVNMLEVDFDSLDDKRMSFDLSISKNFSLKEEKGSFSVKAYD